MSGSEKPDMDTLLAALHAGIGHSKFAFERHEIFMTSIAMSMSAAE